MIYIREFEFYSSDGYVLAVPCDMSGGTFGVALEEAAESAADWLFETITDHLIANEVVPGGKLGHEPVHGGKVIAIGGQRFARKRRRDDRRRCGANA